MVTTAVFAAAVDDRVIAQSPCRKVRLPKDNSGEVVPPSVEQVDALADAIGDQWRPFVVTLAGSGLRIGELLGLEVTDVDLLRREIRVERQRDRAGRIQPVKSKTSRRVVPVGRIVIDTLAAHLAANPSEGGALIVDELGEPLRYRRWRSLMESAAAAIGFDVTSHDLHFYASALIAGGASVKQVQHRLGHPTAVIALNTYAHLWPDDDDRTRDVIDVALSPLADSLRTAEA
jgi:integrase